MTVQGRMLRATSSRCALPEALGSREEQTEPAERAVADQAPQLIEVSETGVEQVCFGPFLPGLLQLVDRLGPIPTVVSVPAVEEVHPRPFQELICLGQVHVVQAGMSHLVDYGFDEFVQPFRIYPYGHDLRRPVPVLDLDDDGADDLLF